jgi:hypothetical protein
MHRNNGQSYQLWGDGHQPDDAVFMT